MQKLKYITISIILAATLFFSTPSSHAFAEGTSPTLVDLLNYSVLGGAAVTNTGPTTTNGAVGVSPGSSITNFPPGVAGGGTHSNDTSAIAAKNEALTVFGDLDQPCDFSYGAQDLTLLSPLGPGVYCSSSSFSLTGNLTLTGSGVWIFKTVSTLITSPGSSVTGGDPCNVWWRIGSSTTLDTTTSFIGTVISQNGVNAMNTHATLNGRFLALSAGTVTLDSNTITGPVCRPTLTTTASGPVTVGDNITDTAHLVGTSGKGVGGTLTFNVYAPGDTSCVTPIAVGAGVAVSTPGDYTSANYATTTVGTSRWRAFYSGDTNNSAVSTACNDPNETSTVNSPPPPPTASLLPASGFAPQRITVLSAQPAEKAYAALGDLWLEIPHLGVQMPIVGVPLSADGTWDVSWLGANAGWLQGSAFPTWAGNSVLTGHVYDANGKPGPFVHLSQLGWDDKIIVHYAGSQYVYAVRSVTEVLPNDTTAMLKHEAPSWVTLVTCSDYNQASNSYKYRVLVRAVLVEID